YSEVDDAEHEGIKLEFFAGAVRVIEKNGRVGGVEFQRMALGEPDASGRRRPVAIEGSNFVIECDAVIPAYGQYPDLDFFEREEPQVRMPMLPFTERVQSFQLIENGYDKAAAEKEAARCLQCVCPDVGRCHLQRLSLEHGLTDNRFHRAEPVDYHDYEYDFSHDFILRDLNKCINCTQCVRICRDVIGANCYGL